MSIEKKNVRIPEVFHRIMEEGNIPERDMFNTFNMGVGMCVVVSSEDVNAALATLPEAYVLGECEEGEKGVKLW